MSGLPHGAVCSAEGFDGIGMGGNPRWSRAEEDSCENRNAHGKEQHWPGWGGTHGNVVIGAAHLEGEIENKAGSGIRHGNSNDAADHGKHHAFHEGSAHQADAGGAQRNADGDLRPVSQTARQHHVGEVATGHQQHTCRGDEQELESCLILVAHGCDASSAGDQVERLLLPELLFTRLHVLDVASQPVVKLHAQPGFEHLWINARTDSTEQVKIIFVGPLEPRDGTGEYILGGDRQPEVRHTPACELGAIESRRSDPDDGKCVAIDLETCPDNGRVGCILRLPDAIAHNCNQWRALPVVSIGHHSPDPWLDAKGTEKIPGDLLPIECVYRRRRSSAPYAEGSISGLQGCEVDELWSMLAEVFEGFPREESKIAVIPLCVSTPVAAADFVPNPP